MLTQQSIEAYDLKYRDQRLLARDGAGLYFEQYGNADGPPVVIVNNFFVIAPMWRNFTTRLARDNHILAFDLRNQGSSAPADGPLPYQTLLTDLADVLDARGLSSAYLLGTSTSAQLCADFAVAHPSRVRGLILVGPLMCPHGSRRVKLLIKSYLQTLEHGGPAALFAHMYPLVFSSRSIEEGGNAAFLAMRERFASVNSRAQLRSFLECALSADDGSAALSSLACPTLFMTGTEDFLFSGESLRAMSCRVPQSRFELIASAGHLPFVEATDRFEQGTQRFITDMEAGRKSTDVRGR